MCTLWKSKAEFSLKVDECYRGHNKLQRQARQTLWNGISFVGVESLPLLCGVAVGIASPRTLAVNGTPPDGQRCRIRKNAHRPARCPHDAIFATISSEMTPPSPPLPPQTLPTQCRAPDVHHGFNNGIYARGEGRSSAGWGILDETEAAAFPPVLLNSPRYTTASRFLWYIASRNLRLL